MLKLERYFSQLAASCGLQVRAESGLGNSKSWQQAWRQDAGGANPLAELLSYEYYDAETGIFYQDGHLGCLFEISPLVGSNESIEQNLTLFFTENLPADSYLQFLIIASHQVEDILDLWARGRKRGGKKLERLTAYRRQFITKLARDFSKDEGRLARNYRSFVTYSTKYGRQKEQKLTQTLKFKQQLENKLKAEQLAPRAGDAETLLWIVRDLLQMSLQEEGRQQRQDRIKPDRTGQNRIKYDPYNKLADQALDRFSGHQIEADSIRHLASGLVSKIFAPTNLPESFSLAEMVQLLGDEYRTIAGRFVLSYKLANNLGAKGVSALQAAGDRSIHASRRAYARDDLIAQEEANEWVQVKALVKKGESFLTESMLVMLTAPEEQIEIAQEKLKSLYNSYHWQLAICRNIQRIASLAMLPMLQSSYWPALRFFRLTRYALSGEVVAKLPVQGEWKGVPKSGALLIGRRGQLFNFNPYYRIGGGGNYNICMLAPSGSGKSFFLQELVQSMLAADVAVFVLDIGGSYKNIGRLLKGELINFDQHSELSLNPFAALSNSGARYVKARHLLQNNQSVAEVMRVTALSRSKVEALQLGLREAGARGGNKEFETIELLEIASLDGMETHFVTRDSIIYAKSMLAAMCGVVGEGRAEGLIERAIFAGVAKYGSQLDVSKLAKLLGSLQDSQGQAITRAAELADSLYSYTEEGIHGRFFASSQAGKEASFKAMLTVFELEELQNDKPLLSVVLQIILMQITMQFLCGDRSRKFMLVVDEAWMILDFAAQFLERFARTVRKYGGSLVVCTQDLTSFTNKCGTRRAQSAILECATWKLILQQNADGMKAFNEHDNYRKYSSLIGSLRKCAENKFSEVLIQTDGATVVGRLAVDPYSTALFSTESEDFNFLYRREQEGVSQEQALIELARKYGELPELPELPEVPELAEEKD